MESAFNKKISAQLEFSAKNAYPGECCGILIGMRSKNGEIEITEARDLPNQIPDAKKNAHFLTDPLLLYQVEKELDEQGLEILGVYHSHPDCKAILSKEDLENMVPGLLYVILSVTKDGIADIKCYRKNLV